MASRGLLVVLAVAGGVLAAPARVVAQSAAAPGRVIEETPTLECLGVRWLVGGDANHNARVRVAWREAGSRAWRPGPDLFRVETSAVRAELPHYGPRPVAAGTRRR